MKASASKENILKKIRRALHEAVPVPFPAAENGNGIFSAANEETAVLFAQEFSKLGGRFIYCSNEDELVEQFILLASAQQWKEVYCVEKNLRDIFLHRQFGSFSDKALADSDVSITSCDALVARTGTIILSSAGESGRTTSVYAPVHVCVAYTSQLMNNLKDAIEHLIIKYKGTLPSFISFATGPSRTADIEKTLVVGVHGPKEVYCFLLEN
jgi:L-lactate dehydrogenase complex protein LldG